MRALIQRAEGAQVTVEGDRLGGFTGSGLVVLLGITHDDGKEQIKKIVRKIAELRIFEDETSATDNNAPILLISQFTLYGNPQKGRRPSWSKAAPSKVAEPIYEAVAAGLRERGLPVETGQFGAHMKVTFTNDGPYTLLVEA
ncbi:MAG: D-aminoacyl-tRNA deacylase [Winkia neuii]|uniref:D-aminoacyl-tRNA deacylase n=1 Tax=Winkia neuii TaxID=33007 RepID=A0A2I1IKQ6_9ACTO|nr:D-aminoacyl-tRNA deacylase [Winkia neuii]OFJ72787.1 D-tyrosyl-tRNA(Tyr) deacylase [Actinomyces sp. HMSC064C12]OFK05065.1 D-tyrosyl-tRNA(Tyr) deacylase [Actinomyces sp. HMSC072A03]OFT55163.1 D-tyrosyl-tRNA(Tyr) deacylase [Actinomyces sp. HMSC06A08]KWZ72654.1 D-tyrosyl-tRNA(Tyr) deacylase [Winkia neuii]MDK8099417.1 D-aminoacyl-tRNA deacylase [Winkia neuii]